MAHTFHRDDATFSSVSATTDITGVLPVANGGTGDSGTAWTDFTPTITAASGTFTSVSATGRYKQLGKTIFFNELITVTTNGSAATLILATLPVPATATITVFYGRAGNTMKQVQGVSQDSTHIGIENYDGTYPGSTGEVIAIAGTYEAA